MNTWTIDAAIGLLACPVCGAALQRDERTLQCPSRHSFDIARQGYVNLLRGPAPTNADTAPMIAARQRFLASGAYQPLVDAVLAAGAGRERIVEVGAGSGHYLGQLVATGQLKAHLALDISVAAARSSARAGLASAVADTWAGLPLLDASVDAVLCIFAPRNADEFARVLAPVGQVVVVTPGPQHLGALRARLALLDVLDDKLTRLDATMKAAGLQLVHRSELGYQVELSPQAASDLVMMGPNAFHRGRPELVEPVEVGVQVHISSYAS